MAIFSISRISYLRQSLTRGAIQRETGIHWARQEAVLKGTKSLTSPEKNVLNNLYRRTTYTDLRSSGMSTSQASRFRTYKPEAVTDILSTMSEIIGKLAEGATAKKIAMLNKQGIAYNIYEIMAEMTESILEGMRKSKRMYEDWQDYAAE